MISEQMIPIGTFLPGSGSGFAFPKTARLGSKSQKLGTVLVGTDLFLAQEPIAVGERGEALHFAHQVRVLARGHDRLALALPEKATVFSFLFKDFKVTWVREGLEA